MSRHVNGGEAGRRAAGLACGLALLTGCAGGSEPEARAAERTPPRPAAAGVTAAATGAVAVPVATPADLERGLRLHAWRSVADSAAALLAAPGAADTEPADRWRVQRAQIVALAWLGEREALDAAWEAAASEQEPDELAALAGQIYAVLLEERPPQGVPPAALWARGDGLRESFLAGAMQARTDPADVSAWRRSRAEAARRAALPYGHPEGFPRAWLAPDER